MQLPGFDRHKNDLAHLFSSQRSAMANLRSYAEPFARQVLGDQYVDNKSGWLGWHVTPVYDAAGNLDAVEFVAIVQDDRGPSTRNTVRVPFVDPNAPMTHDQRRAMFAAFSKVFGGQTRQGRQIITRMALGRAKDAPVTWSNTGPGTLTVSEASKVLDFLNEMEAAL